ncbi:MAG TPA: isoprenylcysteine carboxylmethyltransferase family protein [Polyangia bacterium]|jgi:methyltransferase
MAVTGDVAWFVGLLVAVGAGRLVEMKLSRRHQTRLRARGFTREREAGFPLMVMLHTGVLVGAAIEVLVARRPLIPALAWPALGAFLLANALRFWVIRSMADHWNVNVVNSLALGVVTSGPYRWVRHPNYVAVFVELLALPLVHTAFITALVGGALHVVVLGRRLALEDRMLLSDPAYRAAMAEKPRFLPRLLPRLRASS